MKTIFGEEIRVGDRIMYITVRMNDVVCSFAIVEEIESYIDNRFENPNKTKLVCRKVYERSYHESGPVDDTKVRLTNPTCILCDGDLLDVNFADIFDVKWNL